MKLNGILIRRGKLITEINKKVTTNDFKKPILKIYILQNNDHYFKKA